jgi:hypothetical protein
MVGDGEYLIKIRSGKPGEDDGTSEYSLARRENVYNFIGRLLRDNLPFGNDCETAARDGIKNFLSNTIAAKEVALSKVTSPEVFAALALQMTIDVFSNTKDILKGCSGMSDNSYKFFKGLGRLLKMVDLAGKFMQAVNINSHTKDLFLSTPAIDTCFNVVGLETFECDNLKDYVLEIVNNRSDYAEMTATKSLKAGDPLTVPNKLIEYYRLRHKGQYVKVGAYSLDASSHYFSIENFPVDEHDYYIGKYYITIDDRTNNKTLKFPVDLTLDNQIFRTIIGKTIKVDVTHYGLTNGTLILNSNGTCTLTFDNYSQSGTFSLNHGHSHASVYQDCSQLGGGVLDKRIIGYAHFPGGIGQIITFNYIMVYEDGTLSQNSFYACPAFDSYGKFSF